jgi:hypothetical protein
MFDHRRAEGLPGRPEMIERGIAIRALARAMTYVSGSARWGFAHVSSAARESCRCSHRIPFPRKSSRRRGAWVAGVPPQTTCSGQHPPASTCNFLASTLDLRHSGWLPYSAISVPCPISCIGDFGCRSSLPPSDRIWSRFWQATSRLSELHKRSSSPLTVPESFRATVWVQPKKLFAKFIGLPTRSSSRSRGW